MAQWQRLPLAVLLEDQVFFPASTRGFTTTYNSNSRESNVLFWPPRAPGTQVVDRQASMQAKHQYT